MKWSNEARVGVAVFVAVIIFVGGIILLRGIDLRSKQYALTVLYRNVNGLKPGDVVSVAGLVVGHVGTMSFAGRDIRVDLSILTKIRLPRDSKAVIKSETIMGGKYIEISPGVDSLMLRNGDSLSGTYEADLSELTSTLAPISSNVLGILENVNTTFDEPTRKKVQEIVINLEQTASQLEAFVRSSGPRTDSAMANVSSSARDLSEFARTLDTIAVSQKGNIKEGIGSFRETAANLSRVSAKLENTADLLNALLLKMNNGEGTLGKLSKEEKLYNHIDSLSVNLNRLIVDIRENPKRYVHVTVF
jgi:phospholipid/cholesterol/gamma-HCH transport system substrate-binding protein